MQIHIARDGKATGPFSLEEVNRQLAAGTLSLTDQAWYEGAPGWMALSAVPGVTGAAAATAAPLRTATLPSTPAASAPAAAAAAVPAAAGKKEPLAIWALVMGLLCFFCCGPLGAITAIVCGHAALSKIAKNPGAEGRGMAIAGLVLGYVGLITWLLWFFLGGLATMQKAIEQSMNK